MSIKLLSLFSFLLFGSISFGQSIFDINQIHTVNINFYDADWDYQLDSLASLNSGTGSGTERILAEVIINGNQFDSCGVRYKGNSSMDTSKVKNPFNIDLNYTIPGQEFQGKDKIKLANCYTDPSMVREALTYEIANQYMDCPRASFVELSINGNFIGIYTNTESIDNEFLNEHFGSSNNPFFKCDPVSFELFGDNSNLAYHPDTMAYDTLYDQKSIGGLTALQALTYELENNPNTIEQHLDVDRALWFLALSSALVHNDGYTAFAHNFYIYQMDNGRWSIILWDVNMSFAGLLWNGTGIWPGGETDLIEQDPYLHISATNFRPLISQLLSIDKYKRMYTAHYKTIMEENISNNSYMQRAQFMSDLIAPVVQNEQYLEYTYQEFQDNITDNVGSGWELRLGLENLMSNREIYLNGIPEFQALQPTISNINVPVEPNPFSLINITADASNANSLTLGYRYNEFDVFTKAPMFDDGAHNDGAAGDGTYGIDITILGTDMQYYFYADNANAGAFSPVRAEYEFYHLSPKKDLIINELSATNSTIQADLNGDYDDWVEVYNSSDVAVNLADYHLSDESGNLIKWSFPNFMLQPDSYFIVWCDDQTGQSGVHANFKLSSAGEGLYLSDNLGFLVDYVEYPPQTTDITYGRLPNGTGPFKFLYPTFGTINTTAVGIDEPDTVADSDLMVYPNPTNTIVNLKFDGQTNTHFRIYDLHGKLIKSIDFTNSEIQSLDVSTYDKGIYIITDGSGITKKLVVN